MTSPLHLKSGNRFCLQLICLLTAFTLAIQAQNNEQTLRHLATTFIGGTGHDDLYEPSIIIDAEGNVIISGYTSSGSFPVTDGAYSTGRPGGDTDRFIAKFSPDLKTLLAAICFGGSREEYGMGLAADSRGNIYIAGYTLSDDLPVTASAHDRSPNGGLDVFISKFSSNLDSLLASTYLGGSSHEGNQWPRIDLCIGNNGEVLVAGLTLSADFPVSPNACQQQYGGGNNGGDAFIAVLDSDLTRCLAATYAGGCGDEWRVSLLQNQAGDIYLCGETESPDFRVSQAGFDSGFNGGSDIFMLRYNAALTTMTGGTLLGGTAAEEALAMRLTSHGSVCITGYTKSSVFPVTSSALQAQRSGGDRDGFVAFFDASLKTLQASTLFGGNGRDDCRDLQIDNTGAVLITGSTTSTNLPMTPSATSFSVQSSSGSSDAFVARLSPGLDELLYGSYFGGTGDDSAYAMALNAGGQIYIGGITLSTQLPLVSAGYQSQHDGQSECFLALWGKAIMPNR